ncbi:hypothetical protein ACHAXA_005224 [Cyclostephanos tholiformis]|uniref:Uncharacterized protein n=1 Tax=Cyclostephanos tholiformis TaxID=382380 RepID=A0ABD3SF23_9STRA
MVAPQRRRSLLLPNDWKGWERGMRRRWHKCFGWNTSFSPSPSRWSSSATRHMVNRVAVGIIIVVPRHTRRLLLLTFALSCVVTYLHNLVDMVRGGGMTTTAGGGWYMSSHPYFRSTGRYSRRLPSCHPHWKVAGIPPSSSSSSSLSSSSGDITDGGSHNNIMTRKDDDENENENENENDDALKSPIRRIYFYHVRKAGGTMIRKYLRRVSSIYRIHLHVMEYKHAYHDEEVGSRNDTFYVTNLRDPIERSISHFKYDARWGCDNLVKNMSFVPTMSNANPFESWNKTGGYAESRCDMPSTFVSCAVNCYVQAFSGRGCTRDGWYTEYNMALDRLLRYNMILVYSKFGDPNYVRAVEAFFGGIRGFNSPSSMYCGEEAREANMKVPLRVSFDHVLSLTRLNKMDNRLYRDVVTSCFDEMKDRGGGGYYSFPRVDTSRFVAQRNRTVID